jgi:twitching motility protein PilT
VSFSQDTNFPAFKSLTKIKKIVTPAISNLIREGKTFQIPSAMQTGKALGMVMLNDALFELVKKGLVEPRDAYIKAVDKSNFESLLTRNGMKL